VSGIPSCLHHRFLRPEYHPKKKKKKNPARSPAPHTSPSTLLATTATSGEGKNSPQIKAFHLPIWRLAWEEEKKKKKGRGKGRLRRNHNEAIPSFPILRPPLFNLKGQGPVDSPFAFWLSNQEKGGERKKKRGKKRGRKVKHGQHR